MNGNFEDPMSVHDRYWLWEHPAEETNTGGGVEAKWLLWYRKSELTQNWLRAISLFRDNKLNCVNCMKVSTARVNKRASSEDDGVIIMYTNADNKNDIIEIGRNIVQQMGAEDINSTYIFYKTNEQTVAGTRATGQNRNYTYRIMVKNYHEDYTYFEVPYNENDTAKQYGCRFDMLSKAWYLPNNEVKPQVLEYFDILERV
jgi:hypothetical protein